MGLFSSNAARYNRWKVTFWGTLGFLTLVQCAPEDWKDPQSSNQPSAIGTTTFALPVTETALKEAARSVDDSRVVRLSISWNGRPLAISDQGITLRFFRQGEADPYVQSSWQDLTEPLSDHSCASLDRNPRGDTMTLCTASLGPLSKIAKVEGVSSDGSETRVATWIAPMADGDDAARLLINLY